MYKAAEQICYVWGCGAGFAVVASYWIFTSQNWRWHPWGVGSSFISQLLCAGLYVTVCYTRVLRLPPFWTLLFSYQLQTRLCHTTSLKPFHSDIDSASKILYLFKEEGTLLSSRNASVCKDYLVSILARPFHSVIRKLPASYKTSCS